MSVNLPWVFLRFKFSGALMLQQGSGKIISIASVRTFLGRAKGAA